MSVSQSKTVNSLIKIVNDNTTNIINEFVEYLNTKVEIEDIEEFATEFLDSVKVASLKQKKQKKESSNPSVYNHFMKYKMSDLSKDNEVEKGDRMKMVSTMWKDTDEGKYFNGRAKQIKKDDKTVLNVDVFDMIKTEWETNKLVDIEVEETVTTTIKKKNNEPEASSSVEESPKKKKSTKAKK